MTPQEAIKFIKDHGFTTAQSRAEFQLAIEVLEEYVKTNETTDDKKERESIR